jgi:hypothetical protein
MDELFEVGQLYKAISSTELVELETPQPVEGLKLLLQPEQVAILRAVEKRLRPILKQKTVYAEVLNAMVATPDWDVLIESIADWIKKHQR